MISTTCKKIILLKTIEKFIFLMFKIGGRKSNFGQTQYSRIAHEIYSGRMTLDKAADKLQDDIKNLEQMMISNFVSNMDRAFNKGEGFLSWNYLESFLKEYELSLSGTISNANSIEHILPQNPNTKEWKNTLKNFRKYEQDQLKCAVEIKERSERLIDFMQERWDLNISDEDKNKLLHLDFVQMPF